MKMYTANWKQKYHVRGQKRERESDLRMRVYRGTVYSTKGKT